MKSSIYSNKTPYHKETTGEAAGCRIGTYISKSLAWPMLAGAMSWAANHSVWLCVIHAIVAWFYLPYWIIFKTNLIEYMAYLVS